MNRTSALPRAAATTTIMGLLLAFLVMIVATLVGLLMMPGTSYAKSADDIHPIYREHCAECHGPGRLGAIGPALLPENLKRLRKPEAEKVIAAGRAATQMPGFADKLDAAQIAQLVELIYTPLAEVPVWGLGEIRASHVINAEAQGLPGKPAFDADPLNLFVVVELGDHHATLLDGDRLEPIHRFKTRFALHGGPKYSPDGRFVYFASRDGWITKYDLYNLAVVAEIRAGINTRNLAISADGTTVMVANYLPHTLVALDARDLAPLKVIPVVDAKGHSSRVSAVYAAPPRGTFIAALKDIPEVWEISYQDPPPQGFSGFVHDYRPDSGEGNLQARFPLRRIAVAEILDDFFFDPEYVHLIGAARDGGGQVVDLDLGRVTTRIDLPGLPHLGSGITWRHGSSRVLATPNLKDGVVSIIDMQDWVTLRRIETLGPGFFMRSHENSHYAWVDVFFGKDRDAMHVIDKDTLEIVRTLRPAPGKTAAHVEFDRYGKYALVSIWDPDGAVVVYDARTLEEVKRLPMNKPSGKYNVHNKITGSDGTSH